MLNTAIHWLSMVGTVVDGVLVGRVLMLKLNRLYAFITLFCAVGFLFDVAQWWLGWDSQESQKLFLYSRFLYAVLFPLVAWDVFEEMNPLVGKMRRLMGVRLVTGVFISALFGLIVMAFLDSNDSSGGVTTFDLAGIVIWAGSCSASLGFVWSLYRVLRKQNLPLPNNTRVWTVFFLLSLAVEILNCAFLFVSYLMSSAARDIVVIVLDGFILALTVWCIMRLRSLPSEPTPAPESVG